MKHKPYSKLVKILPKISPAARPDILALILGGLLLVINLPKSLANIMNPQYMGYIQHMCTASHSATCGMDIVMLGNNLTTLLLSLLGILIIILRLKIVAQFIVITVFVGIILQMVPLSRIMGPWAGLYVMAVLVGPIIELAVAVLAIMHLPDFRISSKSAIKTKRLLVLAGIGAAVIAVLAFPATWIYQSLEDGSTITKIQNTADSVNQGLASHKTLATAYSHTATTKLVVTGEAHGFNVCATFLTGKEPVNGYPKYNLRTDLRSHHRGYQCFYSPVEDNLAIIHDTNVIRNVIVAEHSELNNVYVVPLPGTIYSGLIEIANARVYDKEGAVVDPARIAIGDNLSIHYDKNLLLFRPELLSKVVIEDTVPPKNYCDLLLDSQLYSPAPACPATLNGLVVVAVGSQRLVVQNRNHAEERTTWARDTPPLVFDAKHARITLAEIQADDIVNLVYGGTQKDRLIEIHIQ